MPIKVAYLREGQIEREAAALIAEFEQTRGVQICPPIPIENVIEKHLKLTLEFNNLDALFGVPSFGPRFSIRHEPDILGALYFDEHRIVIDEFLDPDENPSQERRYRFTLAHEGAHWRLHRYLFARDLMQDSMFDESALPSVICRSSEAKKPVEWQADFYASCLLMPRKLIMAAWNEMFPDGKPRTLQPPFPISHSFVEIPRLEWRHDNDPDGSRADDDALDRFARPLAEIFLVSPIAMRIRLEKLGLLHRQVPPQSVLWRE